MPNYRFGKGPIAVTLESLLADRDKATQLLRQLYDENISPDDLIVAEELERRSGRIERNHFNNVFGRNLPGETPEVERALAEREGPQRFRVFREGVRKATLLVLGLDPELTTKDDLDDVKPRDTPFLIEVYWGCGQPYNETWVSWHTQNGSGFVCVVFHLTLLGTNLGRDGLEAFQPENLNRDRGLVVCHADPNDDVSWFTPVPEVGIPPQDRGR
jgi:hypothetical protein